MNCQQSLKETAAQNKSILFCVFIKELGQIFKNHTKKLFLNVGQQKLISVTTLGNQFFVQKIVGISTNDRNFSNKHGAKRFEQHCYGEDFLWISQDRLLSKPWSFKFHRCFDYSVLFMLSQCLNKLVWLLYRVLKSHSEVLQQVKLILMLQIQL